MERNARKCLSLGLPLFSRSLRVRGAEPVREELPTEVEVPGISTLAAGLTEELPEVALDLVMSIVEEKPLRTCVCVSVCVYVCVWVVCQTVVDRIFSGVVV